MSLEETSPIFVLGRQHSGNTLLAFILDRLPSILALKGEGTFFEYKTRLGLLPAADRALRIANNIARGDFPPLQSAVVEDLCSHLRQHLPPVGSEGESSATALYAAGMEHLAARRGKRRWAQKATVYIFYVGSIWQAFPQARLIYLLRNPLDVAASLKRRGHRDSFLRMAYSWNKGTRLAHHYQSRRPDRFLIIRYEDLVAAPAATMAEVCSFCEVEFQSECLQVPRVNPADAPDKIIHEKQGVDPSGVGEYPRVLTPAEESTIRWLVASPLLARCYPDVAAGAASPSLSHLHSAVGLTLLGLGSLVQEHAQRFWRDPWHTCERLRRRLT